MDTGTFNYQLNGAVVYNIRMIDKSIPNTDKYARLAVEVASDKLASDILLLDIREIGDFADYFVLMTGDSRRQLRSLSESLEDALEQSGGKRHHKEGTPESGWMVLDFGDVVIHIFGPEERTFYDLDSIWSEGTEVVRIL